MTTKPFKIIELLLQKNRPYNKHIFLKKEETQDNKEIEYLKVLIYKR